MGGPDSSALPDEEPVPVAALIQQPPAPPVTMASGPAPAASSAPSALAGSALLPRPPSPPTALYERSSVCVFPSPGWKLSGTLTVATRRGVAYLSWTPATLTALGPPALAPLGAAGAGAPPAAAAPGPAPDAAAAAAAYRIDSLPLDDVRAVRRFTPHFSWGCSHVVLVLTSGVACPPLYFTQGGLDDLFSVLEDTTALVAANSSLWINDPANPLQRSRSTLAADPPAGTAAGGAAGGDSHPGGGFPGGGAGGTAGGGGGSVSWPQGAPAALAFDPAAHSALAHSIHSHVQQFSTTLSTQMAALGLPAELAPGPQLAGQVAEGALSVMERLSTLTHLARGAAATLLALPGGGLRRAEAEAEAAAVAAAAAAAAAGAGPPAATVGAPVAGNAAAGAETSAGTGGGTESGAVGDFELLDFEGVLAAADRDDPSSAAALQPRPVPLGPEEFALMCDAEGRVDEGRLRARIARGGAGLAPGLRRAVWPILLGATRAADSSSQRRERAASQAAQYAALRAQWACVLPEQERRNRQLRERKHRVDKDVVRTDREEPFFAGDDNRHVETLRHVLYTSVIYNWDLGYCQGMSDLLGPLLYVVERGGEEEEEAAKEAREAADMEGPGRDAGAASAGGAGGAAAAPGPPPGEARSSSEANPSSSEVAASASSSSDAAAPAPPMAAAEPAAFWCFAGLLDRVEANFAKDQQGMQGQLSALSDLIRLLDPPLAAHLAAADCSHMFFCFRMVLILFKRELEWADVLRLWDVLFARPAAERFHLYIAAAILIRQRDAILRRRMAFDQLLRLTNELTGQLDVGRLLRDAETLQRVAGDAGVAIVSY